MPNMSYCQFENTYNDLSACSRALREEGFDALDSPSELMAAEKLVLEAKEFIRAYNNALANKHSNAIEDVEDAEDVEADAVSAERARRSYSLPR